MSIHVPRSAASERERLAERVHLVPLRSSRRGCWLAPFAYRIRARRPVGAAERDAFSLLRLFCDNLGEKYKIIRHGGVVFSLTFPVRGCVPVS